jgi:hypothetical protein
MIKNGKNVHLEKSSNFLIKNAIYLSLGLNKGHPSYKKSLHPTKGTSSTSNLKISSFCW